jgi:ribosomal protein L37AE/L43A
VRIAFVGKERVALPRPPRTEPVPSVQVYRPILCPYCGAGRPRVLRSKDGMRYLACRACDLNGTGGTVFKVKIAAGDEVLRLLRED